MADIRQLLCVLPVFAGELPASDPPTAPDGPVGPLTVWPLGAVRAQAPEPHAMTKELLWP
ncbi:hypothetical protein [Streptomyces sp. NPDC048637]|uniref:hypothetical protein n=1 Tax=Streptomyces sp. NPDC048637 TaxID=3155636 RepID=UPI003418FA37